MMFEGTGWKILLLTGWIGTHDDIATIYRPDGVGALQITEYTKDTVVTTADLHDLASEHIDAEAKLTEVELGAFRGITVAFRVDDTFWQVWYVANGNLALYMTYNCDSADRGKELTDVKEMLKSLDTT